MFPTLCTELHSIHGIRFSTETPEERGLEGVWEGGGGAWGVSKATMANQMWADVSHALILGKYAMSYTDNVIRRRWFVYTWIASLTLTHDKSTIQSQMVENICTCKIEKGLNYNMSYRRTINVPSLFSI